MCQGLLPTRRHIKSREDPGNEVEKSSFRHFVQNREIVKPGASSQTRGRMIRTKCWREGKKIQIEFTYYQSFSKHSGPQRRKGQCVIKDGAYYCYCAYVLRISRYSDFLSPMLTNTGIFLRSLKLSGESRS